MSDVAPETLADLRTRVDFVLVNVPPFDAIAGDQPVHALDLRLAELTAYFTMAAFGLQLHELAFADSFDAALAQGRKDFCLIQKFGHIFHGAEAGPALRAAVADCDFLMGHIMERGGYYYLHDQCTLVNRRTWESLGCPAYGTPDSGTKVVADPERSADNVHDDYTPLFLDAAGRIAERDGAFGYGWNGISESLKAGRRVVNWGEGVRAAKRYCYAYYGDPREWQGALADVPGASATRDTGLRGIVDFLQGVAAADARRPRVFGDEAMLDIPAVRFRGGLDCVIAPAVGFHANLILNAIGFRQDTRVVTYGATDDALAFKRRLIETWDGRSLAAFLDGVPALASCLSPLATRDGLDDQFRRQMRVGFETEAQWLDHWQRFRTLPHEFLVMDPLQTPGAAADLVRHHAGAFTIASVGDLFDSLAAIALFDWPRRKAAFDSLVGALRAATTVHLVVGTSPRQRVRG